jgi:dTDP-4-amino-4,6-dideoxygalactose transaminase
MDGMRAAAHAGVPALGSGPIPEDQREIRFNVPAVQGAELEYLQQSVASGHMSSGGPFSRRVVSLLQAETGAEEVLLTTSCTTALEMSAMLLGLEPGDKVVVPAFTFSTTALAFAREGARIVFCDVEPRTLGLDPEHLATLLDDSVRAVIPVHYAGVPCDIEGIRRVLADRPDVAVIEDNAHGLFGRWRGLPLGSLGRSSTLSFHETKNFGCGEGGALVLNDARDVDRARILYEKGTNRRAFFLGQVDKYSWVDTGSSFGLADTLAAFLLGQLEQRDAVQQKRRLVYEHYDRVLAPLADELGFRTPWIPEDCQSAFHLYYVLLPDQATRDRVLATLNQHQVRAVFHYVPLHTSKAGRGFSAAATECPITVDVSGRLLRLPFHTGLTEQDRERVLETFLMAVGRERQA